MPGLSGSRLGLGRVAGPGLGGVLGLGCGWVRRRRGRWWFWSSAGWLWWWRSGLRRRRSWLGRWWRGLGRWRSRLGGRWPVFMAWRFAGYIGLSRAAAAGAPTTPRLSITLLELVGWFRLGVVIVLMRDYVTDLRGNLESV